MKKRERIKLLNRHCGYDWRILGPFLLVALPVYFGGIWILWDRELILLIWFFIGSHLIQVNGFSKALKDLELSRIVRSIHDVLDGLLETVALSRGIPLEDLYRVDVRNIRESLLKQPAPFPGRCAAGYYLVFCSDLVDSSSFQSSLKGRESKINEDAMSFGAAVAKKYFDSIESEIGGW